MSIFGRKEIAKLKEELEKKEQELIHIKELLRKSNDDLKNNAKDKSSNDIGNDAFRKRIVQDAALAKSIYDRKWDFTSWYETRLYELLCEVSVSDVLKKYKLKVFAQVRLADIIRVREESLDDFKKSINFIASNGTPKINRSKELVYKEMMDANFDDEKYRQTFLYPLFRSHVDFLICRPSNKKFTPLMAIELFGKEHFALDGKSKKLQCNDKLKKCLFEAVGIGFDNSFTNEMLETASKNSDKLDELKYELEGKILGHIRDNNAQNKKNADTYNERQANLMANI